MYIGLSKRITLQRYYKKESKKSFYYELILFSLATGGVSLEDPRMIFNRNLDIIFLENNSAAISSCRLCSEAFLMFRGAKIIKNTMLLFVGRIGSTPTPHQQIQWQWLSFFPLSESFFSLWGLQRIYLY
jgi:hypothetical protein